MRMEEFDEFAKRANSVANDISSWEIKDQFAYMAAIEQFFETIRPLIDKYDPKKPKKFIMKRLDEQ